MFLSKSDSENLIKVQLLLKLVADLCHFRHFEFWIHTPFLYIMWNLRKKCHIYLHKSHKMLKIFFTKSDCILICINYSVLLVSCTMCLKSSIWTKGNRVIYKRRHNRITFVWNKAIPMHYSQTEMVSSMCNSM